MVCWESRYQGWVQSRQKPQVSNILTEKILLVRWCYGLKCPQRASLALLSRVTLKRNLCTPSMGDSQTLLPSLGSLSPPFSGPTSPQMPCYLGAASCSMDTTAQGPPPPTMLQETKSKSSHPSFRVCLQLTKQSKLISQAGFFRHQPHAQDQRRNGLWLGARPEVLAHTAVHGRETRKEGARP